MIHELTGENRKNALPLLEGTEPSYYNLVMRAVIAGNSPGNIWADSDTKPTSALMRDVGHCYYLAGDPNNTAFAHDLQRHIAEQIAPQAVAKGRDVFKLHYTSSSWEARFEQVFLNTVSKKRSRSLFILEQPVITDWRNRLSPSARIQQIDAELLRHPPCNAQPVIEEVTAMWGSVGDFLGKGFGFCLLYEDRIVCWCTAEYGSSKGVGVGIETHAEYYNRGFATLTAAAFVEYCAARDLTTFWDAWSDNLPSLAVAEKVGFKKQAGYTIRYCKFA